VLVTRCRELTWHTSQHLYYSWGVRTAKRLRDMPPGEAWNDASRRSIVVSIAGFFLPNLLAEFGAVPQLHPAFHFLPGVCGAVGAYFAALALFMGYYHRKINHGAVLAVCAFALPYLATWYWFRLTRPSNSAGLLQVCGPPAMVAIVVYGFLIWWHARQSSLTVETLSTEISEDDYGMPTSRWQQHIVKISTAIGFFLIVLVFLSALASRK
jgi:hypothetical protein